MPARSPVGAGSPAKGPALLANLHPPFTVAAATVFAGKPAPTHASGVEHRPPSGRVYPRKGRACWPISTRRSPLPPLPYSRVNPLLPRRWTHIGDCSRKGPRRQKSSDRKPLSQQAPRFLRPLPCRKLKPIARLLRLVVLTQPSVLQLRPPIPCAGSLTQQLMAYTPVTGVATIAAQHLPQAALRHNHTLARRLLQQAPGQVLDLRVVAQARAVEQPQGHFQGKAFGRRCRCRCSGAGKVFTAKLHEQQVW